MIKLALLYNKNDKGIHGRHWKRNNYRFFQEELPKHTEIDFYGYPVEDGFDCNRISDCDVVILWSIREKNLEPMGLKGFKELNCFKITRAPDAWQIDDCYNQKAKELGIDLVVSFQSPKCQYTYLSKDIPYERFIFGIDTNTYKCPDNWQERRKDVVLSSGVLANIHSPRRWFYHFRTNCSQLPYIHHVNKPNTNEIEYKYLGTDYWRLLTQFRAAISCMSFTSVLKYFEIPMCGCLMFAEVTRFNQIAEMGFEDGRNCIYIDKDNCEQRFKKFLGDPDNPKWKQIADAGRQLVLDNYTNEKEVDRFVQTIKKSMGIPKSR